MFKNFSLPDLLLKPETPKTIAPQRRERSARLVKHSPEVRKNMLPLLLWLGLLLAAVAPRCSGTIRWGFLLFRSFMATGLQHSWSSRRGH